MGFLIHTHWKSLQFMMFRSQKKLRIDEIFNNWRFFYLIWVSKCTWKARWLRITENTRNTNNTTREFPLLHLYLSFSCTRFARQTIIPWWNSLATNPSHRSFNCVSARWPLSLRVITSFKRVKKFSTFWWKRSIPRMRKSCKQVWELFMIDF